MEFKIKIAPEEVKQALRAVDAFLMRRTVEKGSNYWTSGKYNMLFNYALKSIGKTVDDEWETYQAVFNLPYDERKNYLLREKVRDALNWHRRWCGQKVRAW